MEWYVVVISPKVTYGTGGAGTLVRADFLVCEWLPCVFNQHNEFVIIGLRRILHVLYCIAGAKSV